MVNEIHQGINPGQWHQCPGTQNPANLLTCGLFMADICNSQLWGKGLDWLLRTPDSWPRMPDYQDSAPGEEQAASELKTSVPVLLSLTTEPLFDINRYSSWFLTIRVGAWMKCFVYNCR